MAATGISERVVVGAAGHGHAAPTSFWTLTLGSIGVVYGDIGTSPLYALKESLAAATAHAGHAALTREMELDDTAVMLGEEWIDDLAPEGLDGVERTVLVTLGETGIADDVRCHYCCQPPFDLAYPMAAFPVESQMPCTDPRKSASEPPS
jgi:hypothetical protein